MQSFLQKINSMAGPGVFSKGAVYCRQNRVEICSDELDANAVRTIKARVHGMQREPYYCMVEVFNTQESGYEVRNRACSCPAFENYEGICKHLVALLLEVENLLAEKLPPPKPAKNLPEAAVTESDPKALELMMRYARKAVAEVFVIAEEEQAELVPTLELEDAEEEYLSFKLGAKRKYVIKDIGKFVNDFSQGTETVYGKSFTLRHREESFLAESRPVLRFLLEQYHKTEWERLSDYRYYHPAPIKRGMFPSLYAWDIFFKMYEGKTVSVARSGVETDYLVKEGEPDFAIVVKQLKKGGYQISLKGELSYMMRGYEKLYIFQKGNIFCVSKEYRQACSDILVLLCELKNGVRVSEENMKVMYASVLSQLQPYLPVESTSDLLAYVPPPLVSTVYLDLPSQNAVSARMKFAYGEKEHPAFQEKTLVESPDLRGEIQAEQILQQYFPVANPETKSLNIIEDEEALYRLVSTGLEEISSFAQIYATDQFQSIKVKTQPSVSVGVRLESNLLELDFVLEGIDLAELPGVLSSYRMAKKYHRLKDGSFLNLEDGALAEFSEMAEGLDLSSKEIQSGSVSVPKYRALYLDSLLKQGERTQYNRDGGFKKMIRDMKDVSDSDFAVPAPLKSVLRNYQKTGYRWLQTIAAYGFGGILADDMGLGKTIQVLTLLLARQTQDKAENKHSCSLVICPSSLVLNWESEAHKFTPSLRVVAVLGLAAQRAQLLEEAEEADLLVTSYDLLKRDLPLYQNFSFEYEIIDEAQYIKNHSTQNAKAVKAVKSKVRFALTGTPVENSLAELWSIYDYLMPGYLYSYHKFRQKLESPIVKSNDSAAAGRLRKLIQPFFLRRMKKEVLKELPDKIETVLYAKMEEEQKKIYCAYVVQTKEKLAQSQGSVKAGEEKLLILAMITRLRQLCCDPSLVYENYSGGSAKLELCLGLLQSSVESGHKLLLFSQFTSMLQIIGQALTKLGIPFYEITGATDSSTRLELVNQFNQDKTPVFLISLKAGGTGLNLTGADMVIHYDPWWNLSAQNQATDRAHRIGQKKSVQIYKLIAKDTIEDKILEMQENKARLAESVIHEGGGSLAGMSKDEILKLFD